MFTGLISDVGTLEATERGCFTITCAYPTESIALGASIACDGCCLTVTACEQAGTKGSRFKVDVSNETLSCTTLGSWRAGRAINLERPLTPSSELGGHFVTGHVDGVAEIISREEDAASLRLRLRVAQELAPFIAAKGSVALDGTSLTVNDVEDATFGINIIPHTISQTNWGAKGVSDGVNLEVDLLARYVARINDAMKSRSP